MMSISHSGLKNVYFNKTIFRHADGYFFVVVVVWIKDWCQRSMFQFSNEPLFNACIYFVQTSRHPFLNVQHDIGSNLCSVLSSCLTLFGCVKELFLYDENSCKIFALPSLFLIVVIDIRHKCTSGKVFIKELIFGREENLEIVCCPIKLYKSLWEKIRSLNCDLCLFYYLFSCLWTHLRYHKSIHNVKISCFWLLQIN